MAETRPQVGLTDVDFQAIGGTGRSPQQVANDLLGLWELWDSGNQTAAIQGAVQKLGWPVATARAYFSQPTAENAKRGLRVQLGLEAAPPRGQATTPTAPVTPVPVSQTSSQPVGFQQPGVGDVLAGIFGQQGAVPPEQEQPQPVTTPAEIQDLEDVFRRFVGGRIPNFGFAAPLVRQAAMDPFVGLANTFNFLRQLQLLPTDPTSEESPFFRFLQTGRTPTANFLGQQLGGLVNLLADPTGQQTGGFTPQQIPGLRTFFGGLDLGDAISFLQLPGFARGLDPSVLANQRAGLMNILGQMIAENPGLTPFAAARQFGFI